MTKIVEYFVEFIVADRGKWLKRKRRYAGSRCPQSLVGVQQLLKRELPGKVFHIQSGSGFSAPTQSNQRMTVIGELSNI